MINVTHGPGPLVAASRDLSRRSVVVGLGFGGIAVALAAAGWKVDVLAQDASPSASPQSMPELNALLAVYNVPEDMAAFEKYMYATHVPLVQQVPGVQHIIVHTNITTTEFVPADIYMLGTVVFGSQADLEVALSSEEGQTAIADVGNFATGGFGAYMCHFETLPLTGEATPMA